MGVYKPQSTRPYKIKTHFSESLEKLAKMTFLNFKPSPTSEKFANGIATWSLPVMFSALFIDVNTEMVKIFATLW